MGVAYFLILYMLCLLVPIRLERPMKRLGWSKVLRGFIQVALGLAILVIGFAASIYAYSQG